MRSVLKYLGTFIKVDFNLWIYLYFFAFLFLAIWFNYSDSRLYWKIFNINVTGAQRVFRFFLFFSVAWFMAAIPKLIVSGKADVLKKIGFYLSILLILFIISIDSASVLYKPFLYFADTFDSKIYLTKIFTNLQGIVILLFFWLLFAIFYRKFSVSDAGFTLKNVNLKPFYILIIVIVPMVVWASFNNEFTATYPGYKPWQLPLLFGIPKMITAIIYEFVYGIDFIAIEITFRGLLVILMVRYMGRDAVLPMAAVYCFFHFGKPEIEAISSVFGGYFLGVVAIQSRSIAPGVILHLLLAYSMDTAAYIQHYFK